MSSPDPSAIKDAAGRFVAVNPAFLETIRRDAEQVLGRTAAEIAPGGASSSEAQDAEVRADGATRTYLETVQHGEWNFDLLVTKGLLPGDEGYLFGIFRNLTTLSELGVAVHDREALFRHLFDRMGDGVVVVDMDTMRFAQFNTEAHEMLGYTREEYGQLSVADLQAEGRPEWVAERMAEILATGSARFENRHRHKDGTVRDVIVDNSVVDVAGRKLLVTVLHDITDIRSGVRMLNEAQALAKLGSWQLQVADQALTWSDETYRIFEVEPKDFAPTFDSFVQLVHPDDRELLVRTYQESVAACVPYDLEHRIQLPGGIKWVRERGLTEYDATGVPVRSVGTCQDVTERHEAQEHLERIAFHDQLTGLPNRVAAYAELDRMLRQGGVAVLQVDLQHFQQINGIYGHNFGDAVLRKIGDLVATVIEPADHFSRVGGDEFMILRPDVDADAAMEFAERVRALVEDQVIGPFGVPVRLEARIGVTTGRGPDGSALLKQADTALHLARDAGGAVLFSPEMAERVRNRLLVLSRFGVAMNNGELFLEYQPQCRADGQLVGIEALVRWRNIQGEVIPPGEFIPVIEDTSMMERLGCWVLDEAARQLAAWRRDGLAVPPLSVNVSARQFQGPRPLSEVVMDTLARHGLRPESMELEMTESIMMPTAGEIPRDVARLADLGIPLAVDDFGTGYSSLSVLYQLPVDKLKVDRSLICGLPDSQGAAAVIEATVAMARAMGLECLAEGVETQGQLQWLVDAGCESFQGFFFAHPQPAADFAAHWLAPVERRPL